MPYNRSHPTRQLLSPPVCLELLRHGLCVRYIVNEIPVAAAFCARVDSQQPFHSFFVTGKCRSVLYSVYAIKSIFLLRISRQDMT